VATKPTELYDADFFAWTQQQAKALRESFKGDNRLDVEHLAEEIEDLGKSELHAVEGFVENVIEHFLKLDYSGWVETRNHWRAEADAFRASIERKITPRIRQQVEVELAALYERARRAAARSLHQREPDFVRRLPKRCPYSWDVIWHRDVMAEAGVDLSAREDAPKRPRKRKA
jgi:hypothetical protein